MKRVVLPAFAALILMASAVGCCHRSCYDPWSACNCGTWQPLPGGYHDCCNCGGCQPWSPGPCCGPMMAGGGCETCGQPYAQPYGQPGCGCAVAAPCAGPVMDNGCGCGAGYPAFQSGPAPMMRPAAPPTPAPPVEDPKAAQYQPNMYYQVSPQMMMSQPPQMMNPAYTGMPAQNAMPQMVPFESANPIMPASNTPQQQWVPARN